MVPTAATGTSERGAGADRGRHRDAAEEHEGHRHERSSRGDEAADDADPESDGEQRWRAGQRARGGRLAAEQDLRRAGIDDRGEGERQNALRQPSGERAREQRARDHAGADAAHERPVDAAEALVRAHARRRREEDRRHAGAEREVHGVRGSEMLRREHRRQHGDERHAAADAEQAREKADHRAGREIGEHPGGDHRASMASRLPRAASLRMRCDARRAHCTTRANAQVRGEAIDSAQSAAQRSTHGMTRSARRTPPFIPTHSP